MGAARFRRILAVACLVTGLSLLACASEKEIPPLPDDVPRSGDANLKPSFGPEIIVTRPVITRGTNPRIQIQTLPGAMVTGELTWPNGQKAERIKTKANANGVAQIFWQIERDPGRGRVDVHVDVKTDQQQGGGIAYFEIR